MQGKKDEQCEAYGSLAEGSDGLMGHVIRSAGILSAGKKAVSCGTNGGLAVWSVIKTKYYCI